MNTLRDVLAITWKELQVRARDRGSLAVLFLLPLVFGLMLTLMYTSSFSQDDGDEGQGGLNLPVYVVNEDLGSYGQQVVEALQQTNMVEINEDVTAIEADIKIGEGERLAAIIIPEEFSAKIDDYEPTEVIVLVDPTQPQFASIIPGLVNYAITGPTIQGEIQYGVRSILNESGVLEGADEELIQAIEAQNTGAIMTQLQAMQQKPAISIESKDVSGETTDTSFNFTVFFMPAFTVMFAFFLVGVIGLTLHTEKDNGTFRRLLASPIKRSSIIGGNMIAYMGIVFLQVVVLFGFSAVLFSMPLGSSPLALMLLTLALGLCVSCMGLLIGALTKTGKQADTVGVVLGFVLAGLGGALPVGPPLYETEGILGFLSRLTPQAHALQGYRLILSETGELGDTMLQVAILLVMAAVMFAIATWRLKFD